MTYRQGGSVALKTLGIYWMLEGIQTFVSVAFMPFLDTKNYVGIVNFQLEILNRGLMAVTSLLAGAVLAFGTARILSALKILDDTDQPTEMINQNKYVALGLAFLGIYFVVPAIGALAPALARLWALRHPGNSILRQAYIENYSAGIINNIVNLFFGCVLILGREGLLRVWKKMRPMAGHDIMNGRTDR